MVVHALMEENPILHNIPICRRVAIFLQSDNVVGEAHLSFRGLIEWIFFKQWELDRRCLIFKKL